MRELIQWEQGVRVTRISPQGTEIQGNRCMPSRALVLAGSGVTDPAGQWHLDIRGVLCFDAGILEGASLVATPTYTAETGPSRPVFVTTELREVAGNLQAIVIRSWDGHHPAPNVPFSWHLVVNSVFVAT